MPGLTLVASEWLNGSLFFRKKSDRTNILTIAPEGLRETLSVVDVDSQHATLLAATVAAGILTHNSKTGAGNLTMDTGANYEAAFPGLQVGECLRCYYVNRGDQTVTLQVATGVTLGDVGQTVATNESCEILLRKTATDTFVAYHFGA